MIIRLFDLQILIGGKHSFKEAVQGIFHMGPYFTLVFDDLLDHSEEIWFSIFLIEL